MIRVTCPACGKRLKVPVAGAGRTVKCPRCAAAVAVPANATPDADGDELDLTAEPPLGPLFEEPPAPAAPPPIPAAEWQAADEPAAGSTNSGRWAQAVIGSLLAAVPVLEAASDGRHLRAIRDRRAGRESAKLSWGDVGGLFREGLPLRLVIYGLCAPALILSLLTVFADAAWINRTFVNADASAELSAGRQSLDWVVLTLLNTAAVVLDAVLFLTVPMLARRAADGTLAGELFDPRPALRLAAANVRGVAAATAVGFVPQVAVVLALAGVAAAAGWLAVFGWPLVGAARFWNRAAWANQLARMEAISDPDPPA